MSPTRRHFSKNTWLHSSSTTTSKFRMKAWNRTMLYLRSFLILSLMIRDYAIGDSWRFRLLLSPTIFLRKTWVRGLAILLLCRKWRWNLEEAKWSNFQKVVERGDKQRAFYGNEREVCMMIPLQDLFSPPLYWISCAGCWIWCAYGWLINEEVTSNNLPLLTGARLLKHLPFL